MVDTKVSFTNQISTNTMKILCIFRKEFDFVLITYIKKNNAVLILNKNKLLAWY
jgi:hypothetical protein